ncbi:disease resistance protein Pik-1-like [Miscanthus floridulus]|uniref:disease resistance protein Pik-1-like n=1 Tax=Miscanthus floridulus TaxID=154761 RepID=UPI003459EEFD
MAMQAAAGVAIPVAVTAATGALGPVLAKLYKLLEGDVCTPDDDLEGKGIRDNVEFIVCKLQPLHYLLLRIWEREDADAACRAWMAEARKLSYDMEDDIDSFVLSLEHGHGGGNYTNGKSLFESIKQQVLELVGRCCEEWVALSESQTTSTKHCEQPLVNPRSRFHHKDASELEEMEGKKEKLSQLLQEHEMVCIHGSAGMGKTTLADLVYQEIGNQFECRAFVSLSPQSDMLQILTTLLTELTADHVLSASNDEAEAADKRYLVVVDDVWHWKQWEVLSNSLPKNNLRSRIIMDSRVDAVVNKCITDNDVVVYKIEGLCMETAEVLSQRILKEHCKADMVPSDMHSTCYSIAKMSGGMPLAVVCLSLAVAEQLTTQEGFDRFHVAVIQALEGLINNPCLKPLVESFGLGYNDLPLHLKTCLLHCSVYPPYHILERDDLARMWIAERFVYVEEEARSYVDELGNRGLIRQCSNGLTPPQKYEMDTMMLHFLRCKSREDNCCVASLEYGSDMSSKHATRIHRLCIQGYNNKVDTSRLDVSNTRSLYVFDHGWRTLFKDFEHLRVLHLHGNHLKNADLVDMCDLPCLTCLSLKGTLINLLPKQLDQLKHLKILNVSNTGILCVPNEIGELLHLETLDISNTMVTEVPREIGRLRHLKTLDLRNSSFSKLPSEIGDLGELETIDISNTMVEEVPREIRNLQHLKILNICNTEIIELPWEAGIRTNLLSVLAGETDSPKVVKLLDGVCKAWENGNKSSFTERCKKDLGSTSIPSVMLFDHFGTSWEPLHFARFKVTKRQISVPSCFSGDLRDISSLEINLWEIKDNDLKIIREMPNLQVLALRVDALCQNKISISHEGFDSLHTFCVDCRVPRVTFEKGAMKKLKYLEFKFYACRPTDEDNVGISHLQSLRMVVFRSAPWYKSDTPGIKLFIDKVTAEAKEHFNQITICINGKEKVLPANKGADNCEDNTPNGAGSSGTDSQIKASFPSDGNMEDVRRDRNYEFCRIRRANTYS